MGEPVTWCHHMVIRAKKNGKPRRTVDSRHSTSMPNAKLTTYRAHSIRHVPYLRRLSLTVGTATTVFPFTQTTATSPPLLSHGGDTDTKRHPRGTEHQVMATPEDLMRLSPTSLTRPNALMAHFSGPTISPRASSKQLSGSTSAAIMASSSTLTNLYLGRTLLNLLALKSPPPMYDHARNTLTQYPASPRPQTSPICAPGLDP